MKPGDPRWPWLFDQAHVVDLEFAPLRAELRQRVEEAEQMKHELSKRAVEMEQLKLELQQTQLELNNRCLEIEQLKIEVQKVELEYNERMRKGMSRAQKILGSRREVTRILPGRRCRTVRHNAIEIGRVGNVARNIAALGAQCIFVGLVGHDVSGPRFEQSSCRLGAVALYLVCRQDAATTRKVRFVSEYHSVHLVRADWETIEPASAEDQSAIIAYTEAHGESRRRGAVRLAKGALTERVIGAVIDAARCLGRRALEAKDLILPTISSLICSNLF